MQASTKARIALLTIVASSWLTIWPFFPAWGNRIHPRVLGLPWSMVYVLAVLTLNFGLLLTLYLTRSVDHADELEPSPDPGSGPDTGEAPSIAKNQQGDSE